MRELRRQRPETPILLVGDRSYASAWLKPGQRERNDSSRRALRSALDALRAEGVEDLHYLEGSDLLGGDGEATVDTSHPTDLGFVRQARAFRTALDEILR